MEYRCTPGIEDRLAHTRRHWVRQRKLKATLAFERRLTILG